MKGIETTVHLHIDWEGLGETFAQEMSDNQALFLTGMGKAFREMGWGNADRQLLEIVQALKSPDAVMAIEALASWVEEGA